MEVSLHAWLFTFLVHSIGKCNISSAQPHMVAYIGADLKEAPLRLIPPPTILKGQYSYSNLVSGIKLSNLH